MENETQFYPVMKIKINEITLREMMLVQSIYACKSQSEIELLIRDQPTPIIFFKVFFELGVKAMVQYLSFDSRSIKRLLSKENAQYFSEEFPVFFKNEQGKSGLDVALDLNQIRSVNLMIDYLCQF